eukprot:scaffold529_cov308-Pinguiococcus_pyrenoidosus.AAC.78
MPYVLSGRFSETFWNLPELQVSRTPAQFPRCCTARQRPPAHNPDLASSFSKSFAIAHVARALSPRQCSGWYSVPELLLRSVPGLARLRRALSARNEPLFRCETHDGLAAADLRRGCDVSEGARHLPAPRAEQAALGLQSGDGGQHLLLQSPLRGVQRILGEHGVPHGSG